MSSNVSDQNPVEQVTEVVQIAPTDQELSLVAVENEHAVTTSLRVAEVFGKEHYNVMKAIKSLDCSEEFRAVNFNASKIAYQNGNIKKQLPMYYITRDGFMFLVMGFTGKTAAKWKEAYIKAFNEMEAKIRAEQMAKAIEEHDRKEAEEYEKLLEREAREEAEVDRRVKEYARQRTEEAKAKAEAQARANDQGNGEAVRIDTTRCGWSVLSYPTFATIVAVAVRGSQADRAAAEETRVENQGRAEGDGTGTAPGTDQAAGPTGADRGDYAADPYRPHAAFRQGNGRDDGSRYKRDV